MTVRWDTAPQASKMLHIRMLSGKHIGFESIIPDSPYVVIHHKDRPQMITIVLPGLTGDALILGEPQEN